LANVCSGERKHYYVFPAYVVSFHSFQSTVQTFESKSHTANFFPAYL